MTVIRTILISLLLLSMISGGCGLKAPSETEQLIAANYTNRFEAHTTELERRLNLNGSYRYSLPKQNKHTISDTIDVLFYADGSTVADIFRRNNEPIDEFFSQVIAKGRKHSFYSTSRWGVYELAGDTIKAQYLSVKTLSHYRDGFERWYLITPDKTIQLIKEFDLLEKGNLSATNNLNETLNKASFQSLKAIPPPFNWMKEKKQFWRKENDWRLYRDYLKKNRVLPL